MCIRDRIMDKSLSTSNSPILPHITERIPLVSPLLLSPPTAARLKAILRHYPVLFPSSPPPESQTTPDETTILLSKLPPLLVQEISSAKSVASRAYITADYFGDRDGMSFWLLVKHQLSQPQTAPLLDSDQILVKTSAVLSTNETEEIETTEEKKTEAIDENKQKSEEGETKSLERKEEEEETIRSDLPRSFALLFDGEYIKMSERKRVAMNQKLRQTPELNKNSIEKYVMLGERARAMEILLRTPPSSKNFFMDALKACVVAATTSPQEFERTIELVAMNLVANGLVDEGVQLLCLIDRGVEACRHLQNNGRWSDAASLAQMNLSREESKIVFTRWACHLIQKNRKKQAINILLNLCEYHAVLQLLFEEKLLATAVLFLDALRERGITDIEANVSFLPHAHPFKSLLELIYFSYGNYVAALQLPKLAEIFRDHVQ
eukprot:TRINITY_DN1257_c0_g3_i1.p1 TRINITY_DN1257_c0_g3~~TRINITY_DN1257_c0_g3_i1.p1  ORF type:complete len:436 (-),score=78.25 TRINITY_DN1257_c0_g3_i1:10-1317(-)